VSLRSGSGIVFMGGSAEWIVERPATGPDPGHTSLVPFPDYGTVFFSGAIARTRGGLTREPSLTIDMTSQGAVISTGTIASSTLVKCAFVGPRSGLSFVG
jgi:hypothetical protein